MSVHTWGEAPHGNWQLEIHNEGRYMGKLLLLFLSLSLLDFRFKSIYMEFNNIFMESDEKIW